MTELRVLPEPDDIYRQLAQRLDALPNKFPATPSGVEFRLLKKLFTEDEAALASAMSLTAESAPDIAARLKMDPKLARDTLKKMVAKGLIDLKKGDGGFAFAVRPFVVGFYEGQLPRMDVEMAGLFEEYFRETKGGVLRKIPALHRVIPIGKAIPFHIDIHPYEQASRLLGGALSWGVRDCICRKQQHLLGKDCGKPLEACLVFAPVAHAFDRSTVDRAITKEEALEILRKTEEAGLVHSTGNYRDGIEYICNCCTCCCGIMRGIAEYGIAGAIARSDFHIVAEQEACSGCGVCIERCQFHALSVPDGAIVVQDNRCVGCGLCVLVCATDALHLHRRQDGEVQIPPRNIEEWRAQRSAVQEDSHAIDD